MNTIRLNPFKYPGLQTATLTNNVRSGECKKLRLVGEFVYGATDGYVDLYLNYQDATNKTRVRLTGYKVPSTETVMSLDIVVPQANTYLLKSSNFDGYLDIDLGSSAPVESTIGVAEPTVASPMFNPKLTIKPDTYAETETGVSVDLGVPKGRVCTLLAGIFATTTPDPVSITVEESADENTWSPVTVTVSPSSAIPLTDFEAPASGVAFGSFVRTQQYVRAIITAAVNTDLRASVIIVEN